MQYQLYFTKLEDFTWKVSECEELVGDTHRLVDQENPYLDHYHSFDRSYEIFALIPFVGIFQILSIKKVSTNCSQFQYNPF